MRAIPKYFTSIVFQSVWLIVPEPIRLRIERPADEDSRFDGKGLSPVEMEEGSCEGIQQQHLWMDGQSVTLSPSENERR